MKILLVDDELDVLNTIETLLKEVRPYYEITSINNGKEAIDFINDNHSNLDIIISDINMEEVNGVQLAQVANIINPKMRIILMSGFISIVNQIKYYQLGIEKILIKPFDIDELISVIENPVEKIEMPMRNMIPVKIESLIDASKIPADLYVHLSEEKFIKIFNAKQIVDSRRLKQFLAKNVVFLYAKARECLNLDLVLYLPVRMSLFKPNRILTFNVFYLESDNYKKLIPTGSVLSNEMLDVIKEHQIKTLYILDKEQPLFLSYLDMIIGDYIQNAEIPREDKLATTSHLVETRTKEVYLNPSRDNIINLQKSQKHLMNFLRENNDSIKDLLQFNENNKGIYIHSSMVASLSYALLLEIIAMRKNEKERAKIRALEEYVFDSEDAKETIFTGALLHDLGKPLLQINESIILNTDKESESLNLLKSHPQAAFDKLNTMSDIFHPKSLEIIVQHEEFCDGSGYPNKLKKVQLGFFSQVVSLVNYFDKLKRYQNLNNDQAIAEIKKNPEKFNRHIFPVLEKILQDGHRS